MIKRYPFTLVEMLTVVAIIIILMGAAWGVGSYVIAHSKRAKTKAQVKALELAIESYNQDWGYYPQNGRGSAVELDEDEYEFWETMRSPTQKTYLDFQQSKFPSKTVSGDTYYVDPYDQPFRYQLPSGSGTPRIWSVGADGNNGTDDDISNKDID